MYGGHYVAVFKFICDPRCGSSFRFVTSLVRGRTTALPSAADSARVGDDFVRGFDEPHELSVARRERKDILPDALDVLEVPLKLGIDDPAHHTRHRGGVGELADDVRGEDARR